MSMNLKQKELSHHLFARLKQRFPEVRFAGIEENPNDPDTIWVNMVTPQKDDRYLAFVKFSSKLSSDILDNFGYHIMSVSAAPREVRQSRKGGSASQKRAIMQSRKHALSR